MDCADLVQGYAATLKAHGRDRKAGGGKRAEAMTTLLPRREELVGRVKRVSGTNRLTELKPTRDGKQKLIAYGVDPASRYVHLPRSLPLPMYDTSRK